MKKTALHLIGVSILSAQALPTFAEIDINGFATVAGGATTSKNDTIYGYDSDVNFEPDSLLGLQISSDLTEGLSATAQLISKGADDWEVDAEWAYISYEFTDYFKMLAGKQRAPFYSYSDYIDVGYAYHWIRPPEGVYNLPFDSVTGLGMLYTQPLGPVDSTIQFLYGRNNEDISISGTSGNTDTKDLASLSWAVTYNWLTLRAGYSVGELNLDLDSAQFDALVAGWTAAGFTNQADHLEASEDDATFAQAGFTIDINNILVVGEWTELDTGDNFLAKQESAYISFGYKFGSVMPHITYGEDEDTADSSAFMSVPSGLDPALDVLKLSSIGFVESQKEESEYVTVGVRWDFHDSAALKLEYTDFKDQLGTSDASLVRAAITTVF